jgi:hypothetical protein
VGADVPKGLGAKTAVSPSSAKDVITQNVQWKLHTYLEFANVVAKVKDRQNDVIVPGLRIACQASTAVPKTPTSLSISSLLSKKKIETRGAESGLGKDLRSKAVDAMHLRFFFIAPTLIYWFCL